MSEGDDDVRKIAQQFCSQSGDPDVAARVDSATRSVTPTRPPGNREEAKSVLPPILRRVSASKASFRAQTLLVFRRLGATHKSYPPRNCTLQAGAAGLMRLRVAQACGEAQAEHV